MKFIFDWLREYDSAIPAMLDGGIDILIYAGDADFVCNWMGNQAWVEALDWKGKEVRCCEERSDEDVELSLLGCKSLAPRMCHSRSSH